jgi:hypothetical protein
MRDQPIVRNLYLTTNNIFKRTDTHALEGLEPAIPAGERRQTHALDPTATEIRN